MRSWNSLSRKARAVSLRTGAAVFVLWALVSHVFAASESFVFTKIAGQPGDRRVVDGPAAEARFDFPVSIVRDAQGNLFVGEWYGVIRKITPDGTVSTIAGKAGERALVDGQGGDARLSSVAGLALDSVGNLFAADFYNHAIRKITPGGTVTTIAGGSGGYLDGVGRDAKFVWPEGITLDPDGNILVSDFYNENIRKITPAGVVTTLAGHHGMGMIGSLQGPVDGIGTAARFWQPSGLALDSGGNLYVADADNRTIRKVTSDGAVTTIAGMTKDRGTNDGPALSARFFYPKALAIDALTNIYVIEGLDIGSVRKISPQGGVSTIAMYDESGNPLRFRSAEGIAVDADGNLYVTDGGRGLIWKGSPAVVLNAATAPAGNSFSMSFSVVSSTHPVIEFADSLTSTNWSLLNGTSFEIGDVMTITDTNAPAGHRFYRLRQE